MHHRPPTMPSTEAFELALSLLGRDDVDEAQAEQVLANAGVEYWQMRRLLVWLPEAFALALLGHSEGLVLPKTFTARDDDDGEHTFAFDREPLFVVAVRRALQMYHDGPRAQFKAIAQRSSTMDRSTARCTPAPNSTVQRCPARSCWTSRPGSTWARVVPPKPGDRRVRQRSAFASTCQIRGSWHCDTLNRT